MRIAKLYFIFILAFPVFINFSLPIAAQNFQPDQQENLLENNSEKNVKKLLDYPTTYNIFINMGSTIQINQAPLPSGNMTVFSFGIGGSIGFAKWFAFMPHIQFFGNYYLWNKENALPSPPENRTAYVPAILLDFPMCFVCPVGKTQFSLGAGFVFYARVAFLTDGVPPAEQDDVKKINNFFWSNGRFFMPSFQLAWDFGLTNDSFCGIFVKYLLPMGSWIDKNSFSKAQETIISAGIRFGFDIKIKKTDKQKNELAP
ncbi:MAG: hypothetical protein ACTTHG_03330 [Treponemataceae bacterium]